LVFSHVGSAIRRLVTELGAYFDYQEVTIRETRRLVAARRLQVH